ncbi:hypothetical protein AB0J82_27435 [Asanoa sp. NPDC049518]|uniref:hypothetical protein n=1 Tax=unclassified Asanoa TaxID=2685164 RepID=UPI003436777C
MKRTGWLASMVVSAVVLTGCGGPGGREDAATAVAVRFLEAVDGKDGEGACATLAPETLADVEKSADAPCAQAILDEDLPGPGKVMTTNVYGQWAQVRMDNDTVFLAVFPGQWRVVAAGCQPRGDRPYDCAVQGD